MKTLTIVLLLTIVATTFAQQKETFDLATYTVPKGWKKINDSRDVTGYAITDNQNGTYCQVAIYKCMKSMGNAQLDFEAEWSDLIVKPYKVTTKPEVGPSTSEDGWEAKSGVAPFDFNGAQSIAMLVTMSGFSTRMSIVILTNTQDYQTAIEGFLESVILKKPEASSQPVIVNNATIIGTWLKASSMHQSYGAVIAYAHEGYSKEQYTLNDNGAYTFVSKTFRSSYDKILLVKENGTYEITGNNLTVNPQKSVIEGWSKKDGVDKYGSLLSTQNRTLEKVIYQFTEHYFSGIQEWNLVLQTGKATQRDGAFSSNTTFINAWYYARPSANSPVIELPDGQQQIVQQTKIEPAAVSTGFAFSTTNFDDGWTSTVQDDWVEVTKGNMKVLIHYPNKKADTYNSVLLDGLKNAWNILVAPRYSTVSNFEFKPVSGWQSIEFAEADAVEKATNKTVHVVLFKMNYSDGSGKYLEFITPDKNSFEQEFGAYHETSDGWEKLEKMAHCNKFALGAADLKGRWTNNFSGALQYVNAYTGADAGMATQASNENFAFGPGNAYQWDLGVASGNVGNIKFQSVKSSGQFSMSGNWQVNFSDMEGKPRTYSAFFSCVKGARILWLDDTAFGKIEK